MKFENVYIECKNTVQLNHAIKIAEKKGYKEWGLIKREEGSLYLSLYEDGDYSIVGVCHEIPKSYNDFILENKEDPISVAEISENEMIKKIHQAKKELGLNNSELSLRMGKSRPYIAKMLNQPQSEKVQNKVIAELDKLIDGKNYAQTMKEEVKPLIDSIKNTSNTLWNEILDGKDKEIADLKKVIESKDLAISGLIKQNDEAKKIHDKDVKIISEKQDQIDRLKSIKDHDSYQISELSKALEYEENSHEANVNSLKSKIKRERIIILIVIAILTALFFLKGSIGG